MFKFFIIFFALLLITGCSTKSSDSLSEEKQQELEQEKITEDLEKKADEFPVSLDAAATTEETEPAPTSDENDLKALKEQKTPEVVKPEQRESDDASTIDKTNYGHMLDRFELIPDKQT
ncbi:MAG: LytR family transcriptional regulator, partial [SAR324 cluster bacterium]|nr:LytR family transcriptional regulator [SAR324 cluster bacterium]